MSTDWSLARLALERGWVTPEQVRDGRPLEEILAPDRLAELQSMRRMAARVLEEGLLTANDLVEKTPERFGRYEIVRKLGEGAMGRVYLARDPEMKREVAVKILDRGAMKLLDRFRREMEILASLKHPNIVTVYDSGTQDGLPYCAMEYVGDRSLADAKLPLRDAVGVMERVALACHAAHEKGVVHRDLKPANILLGDRPVVVDFGIAKVLDAGLTEAGQAMGTPYYMSPEQAQGRPVDARSDIYSLGVILYELLTGRPPHTGTSLPEIARKVVEEEPVAPRRIDPRVPRDLEKVALRAMAKEPQRRYATAQALAADLNGWLEGHPVAARPVRSWERLCYAAKRRPRLAWACAAALALIAIGAVVAVRHKVAVAARTPDPELARRIQHARGVIVDEMLRIEGWRRELYKPAKPAAYGELEEAVRRIEAVLQAKDLPPRLRCQGFLATARARGFMGRTDEALRDLDVAIAEGQGERIGEGWVERARILWEEALRESIARNRGQATGPTHRVIADLRSGLESGFRDERLRSFAEAFLAVAEGRFEEARGKLDAMRKSPGVPIEEIAKLTGDLHLLAEDAHRAAEFYTEAVRACGSYVQAYAGRALARLSHGSAGLEDALTAIEINPRCENSYHVFALVCRRAIRPRMHGAAGDSGQNLPIVLQALDKLRKGPPTSAVRTAHGAACVLWASCLAGAGRDPGDAVREAVQALEEAARLDYEAVEPRLVLGIARTLHGVHLGDAGAEILGSAGASLAGASELSPWNPDVHRWTGYQRWAVREYPGAATAWRKAIELDGQLRGELDPLIREAQERK